MVRIECTVTTERADPREPVSQVVGAEWGGFDFSVVSDGPFCCPYRAGCEEKP
ncbi:hypothetical protein ACIBEA_43725 [Streptomyces sp. NPDC051555]|uniref:hypothetical protein n=1 Tax=Streptomyces sp. NPDC051555 TaxID=3365657 RepID=UPI00379E7546